MANIFISGCGQLKCGVYLRAAFIFVIAFLAAAFIRGRRVFEGGIYLRAAFNRGNMVCCFGDKRC